MPSDIKLYPVKQRARRQAGPGQAGGGFFLLEVIQYLLLGLKYRHQLTHGVAERVGGEFRGDKSFHAGLDPSVDEGLLLEEPQRSHGRYDGVLALERLDKLGFGVCGLDHTYIRREGC